MSQNIKNKLQDIDDKLMRVSNDAVSVRNNLEKNITASKKALKDALEFNGLTNVPDPSSDEATFQRYADLIKRLKAGSAMMLLFNIPETAVTNYKRTIILPMYFSTANKNLPTVGDNGNAYNAIAAEIIASSPVTMALMDEDNVENLTTLEDQIEVNDHLINDAYNNIITDGLYTDITVEDIHEYLSEDQAEEFEGAAKRMGVQFRASSTNDGIATQSTGDWEPDTNATYSFIVNWGDGTEAIFDPKGDYESNKAAIWHTYRAPGIYEVTITGSYKRLYSNTTSFSNWVKNGANVVDTDGSNIVSNLNYGMRYYLTQVESWGNTLLTNMANGFCYCQALTTIPGRDTSNSFADVTDFSYLFYQCTKLTELPYNAQIDKGLFSGCEKATNFGYAFAYCSGMTSAIPIKLIDGCPNVTNVAGLFAYSKFTGGVPNGLLAGLTKLTGVSEMFASCSLSGDISDDLFVDCPNITSIYRLFYGCSGVTGKIGKNFISNKAKLTDMRQAFRGCTKLEGFEEGAFEGITSNAINCREAFASSGIKSIPTGVIENLTGVNHRMERMFADCKSLTSIPADCLKDLHVFNARGMFDNCTALTSPCPTSNPDWETYDGINRWYGIFAMTALSDIADVCLELGGDGNRKFPEGKVGAICLQDGTYVDPKNYTTIDANNLPMGVVHSDVFIDKTISTATIPNGKGNLVAETNSNAQHVIFVSPFNDTTKAWTNGQVNAVDIPTIANTSDTNVGYLGATWTQDGKGNWVATPGQTRYNGIAYSDAINEWRVQQGMASATESGGNKYYHAVSEKDKYDAINYCMTYNWVTGKNSEALQLKAILPDAAELWDQFVQRGLIEKACVKIRSLSGSTFTASNCFPMRTGTWYWASGEYSSTSAWYCTTYGAGVYSSYNKWSAGYVRPSLAFYA